MEPGLRPSAALNPRLLGGADVLQLMSSERRDKCHNSLRNKFAESIMEEC